MFRFRIESSQPIESTLHFNLTGKKIVWAESDNSLAPRYNTLSESFNEYNYTKIFLEKSRLVWYEYVNEKAM